MCTALTYRNGDSYFGRNLDLEYSYRESVTVTPRNFPLDFRHMPRLDRHHAIIGMAFVADGYPLYYDAVNEHGLAMAGLNFPGNATYYTSIEGKANVTPFEFIPWLLGQATNVAEARTLLSGINLLNESFSDKLPLSPLHWIIADKDASIVVETMRDGMRVYDNPVGVLTNNPPFDYQLQNLVGYRNLTASEVESRFADGVSLPTYCRGLGAVGLPGDWSSPSRFVRAAFVRANARSSECESDSVNQFFHMLTSVEMPRGCVRVHGDVDDITVYSSCMNQSRGIYYYTTYGNRQITAVDMHRCDLDSCRLTSYQMRKESSILFEN